MPYILLPRLSANAAIAPVVSGQWEDAAGPQGSSRFLKGLADGLDVADNERAIDSIDSIPDIWARPILFRMALFASKGFDVSLHKRVLGEWRALLAMLALQDVRHLRLTVEDVHLAQDVNGGFGQTLLMLAPHDSLTGASTKSPWSDIYIISYNNVPLAISSPTTLIAAAADYSTALAGQLVEPWSTDGRFLSDPVPHLTQEELSGLHLWLKELKNGLSQMIPADVQVNNETCGLLFDALDNYMKDVVNQAGGVLAATGNLVSAGLNMHIGPSSLLDKMVQAPAIPADGRGGNSAVRLDTSQERSNSKPLLIISPRMLQDLSVSRGLSLSQLVVWPGLTASNVKEQSLTGDRTLIDGVSLGNAEWRRPEEFFTERLAIHAGGNALKGILKVPGSDILSKEDMSVILPLKPEILEYFTPQEIAHRIRIAKVGNDIKVQFSFPLSGINGTGIEYQVEKSYPMQEVVYLINNVPVIEIWPNFRRPGWQRYYLYYENSEAQNRTQEVGRDFFYVYPWAYGKEIAGDMPERGMANLYTARLSGFPEALICTVNMTAPGGINAQPVEVGLVLLDEPNNESMKMGQTWQIGIDFGTSSTMIYYRNGNQEPQPLALQPSLFQVTDSGFMRNRTYQNFIPSSTSDQQTGSFLSIFQLLNGNLLNGQNPQIRPLQDGNVFWLLAVSEGDDYFRSNSSQIDTNLKWSSEMVGRLKVAAYVKQICLQSLAEAAKRGVGSISWNFSYPTAFSAQQAMTFQNTCKDAVQETMQDSGFVVGNAGITPPEYWPESKANAYYFSKLSQNNLAGGAVCLDIGAGTTDISIISGQPTRIVYHTSLQFAGRYLFQSIYDHYDIFAPSLNLTGMGKEQRDALIDADMRQHSDEYLHSLMSMTGRADVQEVLQRSQFAAAGIFYYLGRLVGLLHEKGIYEGDDIPDIYVGGNGSRIFPWLCGGSFTQDNPYLTVFQEMLAATSGLEPGFGFRLVLSDTPKVEVACGMVEDKPYNNNEFFDEAKQAKALFGDEQGKDLLIAGSMLAGDEFILNGESRSKTDFISAYDIAAGIRIKKIDELRSFAEKFNGNQHVWGENISISDRQFADAGKFVQGVYAQQTGNKPQKIFVEPVFILELKGFMR